jgi:hypothetical protein
MLLVERKKFNFHLVARRLAESSAIILLGDGVQQQQ